jgi:subtilase family serine protease
MRIALVIVALCAGGLPVADAAAAPRFTIAGTTPGFVSAATRVGESDPSATIDVTVWLVMENRAALDDLVAKEYDPASPLYHHWIDRSKIGSLFGANEAKARAVQQFLQRSGLTVLGADQGHFYVRARGTAASVERAFHVELANFAYRGRVYRSNAADPVIEDEAGAYVSAIQGLSSMGVRHAIVSQQDLIRQTGKAPARPAASGTPSASPFSAACFPGTTTETLNDEGFPPTGVFTGNLYATGTAGCAYTPQQIRTAYGLNRLYAKGYDGTGQTVAIVTWCLPTTLLKDANAFSTKYGLPRLVLNQNIAFEYYQPPGSGCEPTGADPQLSVEWTHAIAPGADIELFVAPAPPFIPIFVDPTLLYAVENSGANVIAVDWAEQEPGWDLGSTQVENSIAEIAAAAGVALNYPSGDDGDYSDDQPQNDPPTVSVPADSPYVTAVGGISLGLAASGAIQFQSGWGTNQTGLAYGDVYPSPYRFGFVYGSGGGPSSIFAAPPFQRGLQSTYRQEPDIAWLADPFTAAIVALSVPGAEPTLQYQGYGGTGLANYMFSALWAIANQAAGKSLGQAAPWLYAAKAGAITDIVPLGSDANVTASIYGTGGQVYFSASEIADPLEGNKVFMSALWNVPLYQDTLYAITFGTDTGLATRRGWDPVTGLGVPNPVVLINALIPPGSAAAQ